MRIKTPHDVFKAILVALSDTPVKVDASKACYILNDYFEKGITSNGIKTRPTITKYKIF
jgi:hypothetical protein